MPINGSGIDWNDDVVRTLRRLWDEGHSTAEIGRRLGISKNAVGGKAHRLDLPSRPSPIRTGGNSTPSPPRRTAVPRLADIMPITSCAATLPGPAPPAPAPPTVTATVHEPRVRQPVLKQPVIIGNKPCCWPIGDPGRPGFRFCTEAALVGKPYCAEHVDLASRKTRRLDDTTVAATR